MCKRTFRIQRRVDTQIDKTIGHSRHQRTARHRSESSLFLWITPSLNRAAAAAGQARAERGIDQPNQGEAIGDRRRIGPSNRLEDRDRIAGPVDGPRLPSPGVAALSSAKSAGIRGCADRSEREFWNETDMRPRAGGRPGGLFGQ